MALLLPLRLAVEIRKKAGAAIKGREVQSIPRIGSLIALGRFFPKKVSISLNIPVRFGIITIATGVADLEGQRPGCLYI